jgi:hypothetical protein
MGKRLSKLEVIWQRRLAPADDVATLDLDRLSAAERAELDAMAARVRPTLTDPRGLAGFTDAELERALILMQHAGAFPACPKGLADCHCYGACVARGN